MKGPSKRTYCYKGPLQPEPRCRTNQPLATRQTSASAPGSSKRCPAPATTATSWGAASAFAARRLSSSTCSSSEPTISNVGARTSPSAVPARSGRPPRDTTARTASGRSAALTSAAAAPVLAPNSPTGAPLASVMPSGPVSQLSAPVRRRASRSMSNRCSAVTRSRRSSSSVSRSNSSVAKPACRSDDATSWLRGDSRLLPEPCAKITHPRGSAPAGRSSRPGKFAPADDSLMSISHPGIRLACRATPCRTTLGRWLWRTWRAWVVAG